MSEPLMHTWDAVLLRARAVWTASDEQWPWMLIGVYPTFDSVDENYVPTGGSMFMYSTTPAPGDVASFWLSVPSIENRVMDHTLAASILNNIIAAASINFVRPGDSIRIPLGIPDAEGNWDHDADAIFWIGEIELNDRSRQTYQSVAEAIVPILWSSPLGWAE